MSVTLFPFDSSVRKQVSKEEQELIQKAIRLTPEKTFQNIVVEVTKRIDCTQCANCCKTLVPGFSDEDIARISANLSLSRKEFIHTYLNKRDKKEYEMKQTPCLFLKENKCSIYDVRPLVCKTYPRLNKASNSYEVMSNARICPIVFNVMENVKRE